MKGWQYMVNTIFRKRNKVCIQSIGTKIEAIQRLNPLAAPEVCRCFARVVGILCLSGQNNQTYI